MKSAISRSLAKPSRNWTREDNLVGWLRAPASSSSLLLTGICQFQPARKLLIAPFTMHEHMMALIKRETEHAQAGRPAHIMAKINRLTDLQIIEALYEASQAGVKIDLIVRGACMIRPGEPGLSQTVHVRSVVGRFLEHSRIFYFANGGEEEVYIGSADWMARNLDRRVEVLLEPFENAGDRGESIHREQSEGWRAVDEDRVVLVVDRLERSAQSSFSRHRADQLDFRTGQIRLT